MRQHLSTRQDTDQTSGVRPGHARVALPCSPSPTWPTTCTRQPALARPGRGAARRTLVEGAREALVGRVMRQSTALTSVRNAPAVTYGEPLRVANRRYGTSSVCNDDLRKPLRKVILGSAWPLPQACRGRGFGRRIAGATMAYSRQGWLGWWPGSGDQRVPLRLGGTDGRRAGRATGRRGRR